MFILQLKIILPPPVFISYYFAQLHALLQQNMAPSYIDIRNALVISILDISTHKNVAQIFVSIECNDFNQIFTTVIKISPVTIDGLAMESYILAYRRPWSSPSRGTIPTVCRHHETEGTGTYQDEPASVIARQY